jgi:hypothetical protein
MPRVTSCPVAGGQAGAGHRSCRRPRRRPGGRDVGQGMDDVLAHLAVYLPEHLQAVLVLLVAVHFSRRVS